ncbi:MAG: bifunctional 5,10-methylene-tetrahydrofolate dehydrogenase/5,10-methylene-tetrahydrofolate cyclohydrolase, partial [Bacteroidetes bacterium QH_9_64_21]
MTVPPDADLIDGRELSQAVRDEVRADIDEWIEAGHRPPFLSAVLVGDNPASEAYVRGKEKDAAEVGIDTETHHLEADTSQEGLLDLVYD